jgi:hypothetical protein
LKDIKYSIPSKTFGEDHPHPTCPPCLIPLGTTVHQLERPQSAENMRRTRGDGEGTAAQSISSFPFSIFPPFPFFLFFFLFSLFTKGRGWLPARSRLPDDGDRGATALPTTGGKGGAAPAPLNPPLNVMLGE